ALLPVLRRLVDRLDSLERQRDAQRRDTPACGVVLPFPNQLRTRRPARYKIWRPISWRRLLRCIVHCSVSSYPFGNSMLADESDSFDQVHRIEGVSAAHRLPGSPALASVRAACAPPRIVYHAAPAAGRGMKIFISYASEQRPIAERIAFTLRGRGHFAFFDKEDLPP